ncbi:unnamed protein product, partial [Porites evermanni]
MFVDGYDEATKTVYEFHGCFYHGCLKCFPNHRQREHNCHPYRTISEVEKKTNPTLINFLTTFGLSDPFNPRDSFFGGRTNGVRSHCVAEEGEEIHYVDINSLYPYVNKTKTYPMGHPDILVNPVDQDIGSYFGIAKVNIHPPPQLYHPVLPKQINSKLMFPLFCLPLCTCSFWGKFGEKPSKTQTFTVTSPGELYTIIEDAGNNIHDIRICTDGIVEVDVSKVVEEVIPGSKTNIFIAS